MHFSRFLNITTYILLKKLVKIDAVKFMLKNHTVRLNSLVTKVFWIVKSDTGNFPCSFASIRVNTFHFLALVILTVSVTSDAEQLSTQPSLAF